jgi:hypothetical protein
MYIFQAPEFLTFNLIVIPLLSSSFSSSNLGGIRNQNWAWLMFLLEIIVVDKQVMKLSTMIQRFQIKGIFSNVQYVCHYVLRKI